MKAIITDINVPKMNFSISRDIIASLKDIDFRKIDRKTLQSQLPEEFSVLKTGGAELFGQRLKPVEYILTLLIFIQEMDKAREKAGGVGAPEGASIDIQRTSMMKGNGRWVSGLLGNPNPADRNQKRLFFYCHGTQMKKSLAPSDFYYAFHKCNLEENLVKIIEALKKSDFKEVFKLIAALLGNLPELFQFSEELLVVIFIMFKNYLLVMPDYPGMGDDCSAEHPYVVAQPLGEGVCELFQHAIQEKIIIEHWNQEVIIGGYSQGGYAAMVATQALLQKQLVFIDKSPRLALSAPAGGPYSLSEVMKQTMLSNDEYPFIYFLPLTIRSFYYFNDPLKKFFSPQGAFNKEYQAAYAMACGCLDGDSADEFMYKLFPDGRPVPVEMLTPQLIAELKNPNSKVCKFLGENDAFRKLEKSKPLKMTLYHHSLDNTVPYSNAAVAYEHLKKPIKDLKIEAVDKTFFGGIIEGLLKDIIECAHVRGCIEYLLAGIFEWK